MGDSRTEGEQLLFIQTPRPGISTGISWRVELACEMHGQGGRYEFGRE